MSTSMRDEASRAFFEKRYGNWTPQDQVALQWRLGAEPGFASAFQQVERSWEALGHHAQTPEMVAFREEALADVRRTGRRRWALVRSESRWKLVAGAASIALTLGLAWPFLPFGFKPGQYQTQVGELRMLELDDLSSIAIDSATRLKVNYTHDAREVRLLEGQAQFSVAHDPVRPFKVQAGGHTIVALGTTFTVEYVDRKIQVAMLDGKVAVLPNTSSMNGAGVVPKGEADALSSRGIELNAGEALKVGRDGQTIVVPQADIEAATAWRAGKVILRTETLAEAVRKMNRYSRVELEIRDPALAQELISGVFEAGNSQGFIEDIKKVLPVAARRIDARTIELVRP